MRDGDDHRRERNTDFENSEQAEGREIYPFEVVLFAVGFDRTAYDSDVYLVYSFENA